MAATCSALEYDSRVHRSSLVILDAADIEGEELAR